jgi:Domain of unknown function (DUF4337)
MLRRKISLRTPNAARHCDGRFVLEAKSRTSQVIGMEESEVPLEHLHEEIHHSAEHSRERWISWVALSTAILAVLAAIAGLLSGRYVNEAMMNQIEASDQWNYYQAKGIKAAVLDAKMSRSGAPDESDQTKRDRYEKEQEKIKSEAEQKEAAAKSNFHKHEVFAGGVTMFQIAIAIAAISALTRRRPFWIVSLLFGVAGCAFLVLATITR